MLEDLLKVINHIVIGSWSITHNEVDRLQLGNLSNGWFAYITVEASHEVVVIYKMNILTCYLLALNFCLQFYAEVKHHLKEQILIGTVSRYILIEERL